MKTVATAEESEIAELLEHLNVEYPRVVAKLFCNFPIGEDQKVPRKSWPHFIKRLNGLRFDRLFFDQTLFDLPQSEFEEWVQLSANTPNVDLNLVVGPRMIRFSLGPMRFEIRLKANPNPVQTFNSDTCSYRLRDVRMEDIANFTWHYNLNFVDEA